MPAQAERLWGHGMLTDKEVAKAAPREKGYKLTDAAGLHVYVAPGGGKSWRLKYRFGGVERRIVFGTYPDISLKRAREMRDDARRLLRDGRDPGLESKRARHARTVPSAQIRHHRTRFGFLQDADGLLF